MCYPFLPTQFILYVMPSSRSISISSEAAETRRYRRSAFNGAKQLAAAQAPQRRVLILLVLLALVLMTTLALIVGVHMQSAESTQSYSVPTTPAIHLASH